MVRSIAESECEDAQLLRLHAAWSVGILFPCFALITYLFFM